MQGRTGVDAASRAGRRRLLLLTAAASPTASGRPAMKRLAVCDPHRGTSRAAASSYCSKHCHSQLFSVCVQAMLRPISASFLTAVLVSVWKRTRLRLGLLDLENRRRWSSSAHEHRKTTEVTCMASRANVSSLHGNWSQGEGVAVGT